MIFLIIGLVFSQDGECQEGQILQANGSCLLCQEGYGILPSKICGTCPSFEGINTITGKCGSCAENECIDIESRKCVLPGPKNAIIDPISKKCSCENSKGFGSNGKCLECSINQCVDPDTNKCINRPNYRGIESTTGKCIKCPKGQGIDRLTYQCTTTPKGGYVDNSGYNSCPKPFGINQNTNECIYCKEGEHVYPTTQRCQICPLKYNFIDEDSNQCDICQGTGYGYDMEAAECKRPDSGYGVDPNTNLIIKCPDGSSQYSSYRYCKCSNSNHGINSEGKCGECGAGYIINSNTYLCEKCPEKQVNKNGRCESCPRNTIFNDATKQCDECPENQCLDIVNQKCIAIPTNGYKDDNKCYCEKSNEHFNPETQQCGSCSNGKGSLDGTCTECPEDQCIDPSNQNCKNIPTGYYRDPSTGLCSSCPAGEATSPNLDGCTTCHYDECMDSYNKCRRLKENEIADPVTKKCRCKDTYGVYKSKCTVCPDGYGIDQDNDCYRCSRCVDPDTKICRAFNDDEGFNEVTRQCIKCPAGTSVDPNKHQCVCPEGRGFNSSTGRCYRCTEGKGVNPSTKECITCEIGEGILETGYCGTCPSGQGIDSITNKCTICPDNQGILPTTNICGICPEGSTLNKENKKCECNEGYRVTDLGSCFKCSENSEVSQDGKKCKCNVGYFDEDGICKKCPDGFTSYLGICTSCSSTKCIDEDSKECISIPNNMGKHPLTNICIACPDGSSRNTNGYCICTDNKGLNAEIECVTCNQGEGINEKGLCAECNPDQCANQENHKCVNMGTQYVKDQNGNCLTECPNGNYYHPSTRICGKCPVGSTESTETGQCNCNENEAVVDMDDFKCGTCPETYGIDETTKKCIQCPKYQCIDEKGKCSSMSYSTLKNLNDGKCLSKNCPDGYNSFSENFNSYCIKCSDEQCFDIKDSICREPSNDEEINAENHLCQCKNKGYGYNEYGSFLNCKECPSTHCITGNGYCIEPDNRVSIDPNTQKCLNDCPTGFNPITKICDGCPEGSSPDTSYKGRCKCNNELEGFIEGENKCGPCPYGYCINVDTGICQNTSDYYVIDPINYRCYAIEYGCKDDFKGIIPSKLCYFCNDDECIDPDTRKCIPIPNNNGKSIKDGTCMECVYPYSIDQKTNNCICNLGQGYDDKYDHCEICDYGIDPSTNKCTNCYSNKEGIDHDTKFCRKCNEDEGIDPNTYECITCTNGTFKDLDTLFCICPAKQGINIETMQCSPCKTNEGIDPETKKCGKCSYGKGIDPDSSFCITCPEKQGIDKNTGMCITCPEKQGIDPFSKICQTCDNDKGINRKTGLCEKCAPDQIIDENKKCTCENNKVLNIYGECQKCNSNYGPNSDLSECINCLESNLGYDEDNGKCVKCPPDQGVSLSSFKCESASDSSCINPNNGHLADVYANSKYQKNSDTSICECKSTGYGIEFFENSESIICNQCKINEGIDPDTNRCTVCDNENGEGIDSINKKCRKCDSQTEAINPITLKCSTSPNGAHKENNFWACPNGQNFDSDGLNCVSCADKSQYIDTFSNKCVECNGDNEMVDESTKKCTCIKKYGYEYYTEKVVCSLCSTGINPKTHLCDKCDISKNEGIDEETGLCRQIEDGEGIEKSTNIIKKCPKGAKVDPFTLECKCDDGYAVESNECKICSFPKYIDSSGNCVLCNDYIRDGKCYSSCNYEQCADKDTKVCRDISFGEVEESQSYICTCSIGFAFETNTKKCIKCKDDEEISEDETCKKCNEGYAVNPSTYKCERCENGNGIDSISLRCGKCKEGEGINPKTRMCGVCENNEGINAITGECENCFSGQFIDSKTKICTCPIMQGADYENKKCISCSTGQGIDPITRKCIECPDGQGINRITGECVSCIGGQLKQETTNFCTCQNGQGFNSEESKCEECTIDKILNQKTNVCERCPEGEAINSEGTGCVKCDNKNNEAIDPKTFKCRKCNENEGIDSITGQCLECPSGAVVNPTSHFCECQALKGIDIDSWMCISCYNFEGIDPVTKKCTRCNVGEGIDTTTLACGKCKNGQGIDGVSGKCRECEADEGIDQETQICSQCSFGEGIISETHECGKCPPGQGINAQTKICGPCKSGEGINSASRKCEQCLIGEGIDSESKECKQCASDQGINSETKVCQKCNSNEQIDPTTKYCVICIGGFGFDSTENICKKCSDEHCAKCTENFNICTACKQGYFVGTEGKCIFSQIDVVKPNTIERVPVELEIDSETGSFKLKRDESTKGKPCTASVDNRHNQNIIVVDDIGQTQTEICLTNVNELTIVQNSGKPIYITNNKENSNEAIQVTIQNLNLISLKGKGKIKVINEENNPVSLDYISPDFNNQLTIDSDSKINVQKLDIYGNSKVEFENKDGALVDTIIVQQKAQTTLKNVEINKEMIIGLQSSVNLDDNVIISKAVIQLTYSNIPQDSAIISGKLKAKPLSIVIKDRNINIVLDEDSEFVIAESSNSEFKCSEWTAAFDVKANSKYNHASCSSPDETRSVRLFADNKGTKNDDDDGKGGKDGLSPGIIALIVIIVVVVIATVIILIWFFVIRKKKNNDSLNENSLSGENNADEI